MKLLKDVETTITEELIQALEECASMLPAMRNFDFEDRKFLNRLKALIKKARGEK